MLLLLLAACGSELAPSDTDPPLNCAAVADAGNYTTFFAPAAVREIRMTMSESALNGLKSDLRTYALGDVEIDGTLYPDVGIRLKGNSSFDDFSGKPAFKIKLSEYCPGQKHADLKRLTLNNMTTDASQSQELVNYQVWMAAGLMASQANYARVYFNEEFFGLYTNVESMDKQWLKHRYDDATGDLWEAGDSADFDAEHINGWSLTTGDGDTDVIANVAAALQQDGSVYDNVGAFVNMDQFLAYWAWKSIVGDDDGYPWNLNDVFLYGNPSNANRLEFSPWGFDEGWKDYVRWDNASSALSDACKADAGCATRLKETLATALDAFDRIDVLAFARAAWGVSDAYLPDDGRRPFTPAEVEAARVALEASILGRSEVVRGRL